MWVLVWVLRRCKALCKGVWCWGSLLCKQLVPCSQTPQVVPAGSAAAPAAVCQLEQAVMYLYLWMAGQEGCDWTSWEPSACCRAIQGLPAAAAAAAEQ